jgi:uncharacterized glyoxalase superfamily protein PhnB
MKFTALRSILWSDKLAETIEFYTSILGFACIEQNDNWGWACLQKDDVEIMVAKPTVHTVYNGPQFTGSFYINTTDVDAVWNTIKDKVNILYSIEDFEWQMREFAICNNNGYTVQLGQELNEINKLRSSF